MTDWLAFVLAAITLLATPGPTNTLLASAAVQQGLGRSLPLLLGEILGYASAILVLSSVFRFLPDAGTLIRLVCAGYLVYAAATMWRNAAAANERNVDITVSRVFMTTLLNPKAIVFTFVVVPYVVDGRYRDAAPYLAALAGLIVCGGLSWIVGGASIRAYSGWKVSIGAVRRATSIVLVTFATLIGAQAFLTG